jgi:hypothetical protein
MDCKSLSIQIENLVAKIATNEFIAVANRGLQPTIDADKQLLNNLKAMFNNYGCTAILETERQKDLAQVKEKYADIDENRINTESTYERNKRIFFAGMILLTALGIIITIKDPK